MNRVSLLLASVGVSLGMFLGAPCAWAQGRTLPKGIGLVQVGIRPYFPLTEKYSETGVLESLGASYTTRFSGTELLAGKAGNELKQLAMELEKYDPDPKSPANIVGRLDMGQLNVDVKANITATFVGVGLGLTDATTLFLGVPWIAAKTSAVFHIDGKNNTLDIRDSLGNLAYEEVQNGLQRASGLNVDMVQSSIASSGYKNIIGWTHSGIGDVEMGAKFDLNSFLRDTPFARIRGLRVGAEIDLSLPTAHHDDPDVLTDVSLGKDTVGLGIGGVVVASPFSYFSVGGDAAFTYLLPTTRQKRVPLADESIIDASRKTAVNWTPGMDFEVAGQVLTPILFIEPYLRTALKLHTRDRYSGEMEGNYASLSANSDQYLVYQEVGINCSTVDLFQRKRFPLPLMSALSLRYALAGKNTNNERYAVLTLASFFPTPLAAP